MIKKTTLGFTLIEVLIALSVIAIALTALFKATTETISITARLKEKSISHWVAMQGVTSIQLGLLPIEPNQEVAQVTTLLNQQWYWRAVVHPTSLPHMQSISVTVSRKSTGPFTDALLAFRYTS